MTEFLRYALLANTSLLMVWAVFRLWLRDITHHGWNRAFLMFGSVLAVSLPLIPFGGGAVSELVGLQLPEIAITGQQTFQKHGFSVAALIPS